MGAYMYPIKIDRQKKVIPIPFTETIEDQKSLTLKVLEDIAGGTDFDIELDSYNRYVVTVHHIRLETDKEYNSRIAKEKAYMKEYHRREKEKEGK